MVVSELKGTAPGDGRKQACPENARRYRESARSNM